MAANRICLSENVSQAIRVRRSNVLIEQREIGPDRCLGHESCDICWGSMRIDTDGALIVVLRKPTLQKWTNVFDIR